MLSLLGPGVVEIYARHPHHMLPFIGDAFAKPDAERLRVMVVGINCYISDHHWPPQPDWFGSWLADGVGKHRYQKGLLRKVRAVCKGLEGATLFRGLRFDNMASMYITNAIKVYLPESEGKRASQIERTQYDTHLDQWHDELDLLAAVGATPHLILIVGAPFWGSACAAFKRGPAGRYEVVDHEYTAGPTLHFVNRYRVRVQGGEQTVLMVRVAHPAARTRQGQPRWLLVQPEFRRVAGLLPLGGD